MENRTTTTTDNTTIDQARDIVNGFNLSATGRPPTSDDEARAAIKQLLDQLTPLSFANDAATATPVDADSMAELYLSDLAARRVVSKVNGGVVGLRTGISHLDETLNGLEAGKLYMLAAVPGCGKTTLALQWAAHIAQQGKRALYISLENDALDLVRKTICCMGGVSYSLTLKGKISEEDAVAAAGKLAKLEGRLQLETPRMEMPDLDVLMEKIKAKKGEYPSIVVLDYLQAFVKRGASVNGGDVRERIDIVTPQLRTLGEKYGCAVVAISAQNRANYSNGGMASLKESGDLEYNADAVITLARPTLKELDIKGLTPPTNERFTRVTLNVEKNRQGMTGRPINLLLDGDLCMFTEEVR